MCLCPQCSHCGEQWHQGIDGRATKQRHNGARGCCLSIFASGWLWEPSCSQRLLQLKPNVTLVSNNCLLLVPVTAHGNHHIHTGSQFVCLFGAPLNFYIHLILFSYCCCGLHVFACVCMCLHAVCAVCADHAEPTRDTPGEDHGTSAGVSAAMPPW